MKQLKNIAIPLILGTIIGILSGLNNNYNNFVKPSIMPPNYLFPIIWSILYILMGISKNIVNKNKYYIPQLVINLIWPIIFFILKWYFLAIIWIIILIILVILMIIEYYKQNKISAYIQIPYLCWLTFALILAITVYRLN